MKVRFDIPLPTPWQTYVSVVFIAEITARAFIIADSNKRRTLSRADIAKAISKSDQFDFLIDIVPREDPLGGPPQASSSKPTARKSSEAKDEEVCLSSLFERELSPLRIRSNRWVVLNLGRWVSKNPTQTCWNKYVFLLPRSVVVLSLNCSIAPNVA